METKNKDIKSPKELFEQKRLQSLRELEYQKTKQLEAELDYLKNKKVLSPKTFFNDEIVEETAIEIAEETIVIEEKDLYQEQISFLRVKLEEIESSIPEQQNIQEVLESITELKIKIDEFPKVKDYSEDLDYIRFDLNRIESSIPVVEPFDASELYENITILETRLEEVRSEIPAIPEPILYDSQIEELKTFIENVRVSIPDVPEIKYYDEEVKSLAASIHNIREEIAQLPEIKYYDEQIVLIENRLKEIHESIPEVKYYDEDVKNLQSKIDEVKDSFPEVRYYDEEVNDLQNKINEVRDSIPEVKYYDAELDDLQNRIEAVKESIPTVPEVKYYDEDVKNLQSKLDEIKDSIPTVPEVKYYDEEIKSLNTELQNLYEKIASIKVPDEETYKTEVKELYSSFEEKNVELWEKIKSLEELVDKFSEKISLEESLTEPPETENIDPLTPLDKNFVTLDQLQNHYKLFINRIQQQLSSIGGGGETRLKYLDDIVGIATNASAYDGKFLKYNHGIRKFEFVTVSGGGGGGGESYWAQGIVGIVTTSNVGIKTDNPTSTLTVYGDALVVGVVTATDFNSASDIKLKENVSVIDNPLDKIVKLEGVNFQWKETGKKSLGVIAQEVEKVLPELVSGEESKTVNYNGIIGLLIECIKEQQKEIDELKNLMINNTNTQQ